MVNILSISKLLFYPRIEVVFLTFTILFFIFQIYLFIYFQNLPDHFPSLALLAWFRDHSLQSLNICYLVILFISVSDSAVRSFCRFSLVVAYLLVFFHVLWF